MTKLDSVTTVLNDRIRKSFAKLTCNYGKLKHYKFK